MVVVVVAITIAVVPAAKLIAIPKGKATAV